jgi:ATP-dependent protease HslVU (ClpYQ) peptidase subunit
MTTIACNQLGMAADKQFTHNGGMKMTGKTKIYELPSEASVALFDSPKVFVGFAGNADNFIDAIQWLHNPKEKTPKVKGIEMLLLNHKGYIFHATTLTNWTRIMDKSYSVGSGMHFAQAAMLAGKTPLEAVKIASKLDPSTGCGFNYLEL